MFVLLYQMGTRMTPLPTLTIPLAALYLLTAIGSTVAIEGIIQSRVAERRSAVPGRQSALQTEVHKQVHQEVKWFNQTLDHFTPLDNRKFPQRYFESLDFWKAPDGPIFLLVCGEYVCGGIGSDYRLVLAEQFGAALVALEHRFYGASHPFAELTTENLSFLSSKQAVVDLATFRDFYQADLNKRFQRSAEAGDNPWLVIGVSYPGALSAWFHLKFPHLTRGSLASSAVVEAVLDYSAFDQQVAASAGPECAAALREVTAMVDLQLARNASAIKARFGAEALEVDGDFLLLLADAAAFAFQYGSPAVLCSPLEAAARGGDVLEAYVDYVHGFFYGHFGSTAADYDQRALLATAADGPNAVARAWWYQCCTEVGYLQTAPANHSIRSAGVNLQYYKDLCASVFGEGVFPDTDFTNLFYGGTKIASSRIFFANGSQDPWRHASKQTSTPGQPAKVVTCHNCGHGSELRGCPQWPAQPFGDPSRCSNPREIYDTRRLMAQYVEAWLADRDVDATTNLVSI